MVGGSWKPLGVLVKLPRLKNVLERLLAGAKQFQRQVAGILGAKKLPNGRPTWSNIGSKQRLELKTRVDQNALFSIEFRDV